MALLLRQNNSFEPNIGVLAHQICLIKSAAKFVNEHMIFVRCFVVILSTIDFNPPRIIVIVSWRLTVTRHSLNLVLV